MPSLEFNPGSFKSPRFLESDIEDARSIGISTTYDTYPNRKPFLNMKQTREVPQQTAFPENLNEGIMNAICKLHDKMILLENDRQKVGKNMTSLPYETKRFNDLLQDRALDKVADFTGIDTMLDTHLPDVSMATTNADITFGATEVQKRLESAEHQAFDLEKALSGMRTMLNERNSNKFDISKTSKEITTKQKNTYQMIDFERKMRRTDNHNDKLKSQLDKISQLEIAQLRLASTQTLSENKLIELEEKLKEEKFHRKIMQEKAAKLQKSADVNQIILDEVKNNSPPYAVKKSMSKHSKRTSPVGATSATRKLSIKRASPPCKHTINPPTKRLTPPTKRLTPPHTKNVVSPSSFKTPNQPIPFVTGRSSATSHSLNTNLQEVWSLLNSQRISRNKRHNKISPPSKLHQMNRCTRATATTTTSSSALARHHISPPAPLVDSTAESCYLFDLLKQLEDEFTNLSMKHQQYCDKLCEFDASNDLRKIMNCEQKIADLVAELEMKSDQIMNLRSHFTSPPAIKRQSRHTTASSIAFPLEHGQVQVVTTIKTKNTADPSNNYKLLKNLRDIKYKLRRQDLSWSD